MREIRTSGLMSGEGKRTAMRHRASPRLYRDLRFHFLAVGQTSLRGTRADVHPAKFILLQHRPCNAETSEIPGRGPYSIVTAHPRFEAV